MIKIWLIARATYRRRVRSGMFLILTIGLPVLMVIAGAVPVLSMFMGSDKTSTIGYVDLLGGLNPVSQVAREDVRLNMRAFDSPDTARAAFQEGRIDGYLVIPVEYFQGGGARYYAEGEPNAYIESGLQEFMRRAMVADEREWAIDRLIDPSELTYVAREEGVEVKQGPELIVRLATPAVLGALFAFMVFTGAGQMGSAVVREKERRSFEMIVTSLAPHQLVAGKVLGMTMLSLTQLGVWIAGGVAAMALALSSGLDMGALSIPWNTILWGFLLGFPGYYLFAIVASGLGIIAGDEQQAQQLAGMLGVLGMMPLWFLGVLIESPDGAAAVALTLFPFTAPMVGMFRMVVTTVPVWQLSLSFVLIVAALVASTWLVARLFRVAMLMYGKKLRPRQLIQTLREA
jgi:ABC-2 type transport system permease protein